MSAQPRRSYTCGHERQRHARLAVHCQDGLLHAGLRDRLGAQRLLPEGEAGLECGWLRRHRDAAEDILSWDPVGQVETPREDVLLQGRPAGDRELPALSLGAGRVVGTAECPEPLCPPRVLPTTGQPPGPPRRTLLPLQSSYGLMRQSHHLSSLSADLMRRVFAGCCHPLLVVGPSRHYPRNPCGGDWTHTPPCPPGACTHFFPGGVGLTSRETRSAHESIPAMRLQQGAVFRGCSHSLMFSLPHSLDPRSHPPRCPKAPGGRAVYTTHRPAGYPGRDVASLRDRSG